MSSRLSIGQFRQIWIAALAMTATAATLQPNATVADAAEPAWKAGTARRHHSQVAHVDVRLRGARNKPSQGVVHDLWAKALGA